ncbi:guanine deaminase [Pseudoflavonifractor sp. 524-17]|uniref:amidohydrolase family protein n=1 Tax=Pseudoflavonifractor sp. 524-17 TaxID=2304577 RepID=UPI00137B80E4|nr:amidohydrolase family protein [Pseudoflavonifractor sp. 524-17]NCE65987.1 guanine deaminase [Pseudoflavonifractor sp. 524-17]
MNQTSFVLKGDICYSAGPNELYTAPDGFLVCLQGQCAGVFPALPEQYASLPLLDYSGFLVTPGLTDLHVHAPQYTFRGLGMDLELLDWLNTHTFPEEAKYRDLDYAETAYRRFVDDVRAGPNTRACIFATVHPEATLLLMDLLEESGLVTLVGKVNMDRNSTPDLQEISAQASAEATLAWLEAQAGRYQRTGPILTPRFLPSCTDGLMERLAQIQQQHHLPVQSHLSENQGEVAWVRELCPSSSSYGDAYDSFGLFGGADCPTIMAHCVLCTQDEIALMKARGIYVAHCPASNTNLASGIAPVRRYLDEGIPVGLGSDVAGGTHTSIFRAMADAVQVSKLRWRLSDQARAPLTAAEAFYLGTLGGGSFFGKVGSFAPGYECDALVIDDRRFTPAGQRELSQRLERTIYLSEDRDIAHKFIRGAQLF